VQREANASSRTLIEKQSGRTMANAFVNVYTTYDSDDETTVGIDMEFASFMLQS